MLRWFAFLSAVLVIILIWEFPLQFLMMLVRLIWS